MKTVKIYQIGLGDFGRHGFEKFVDMANHMEEVNVEIGGICDTDREKLEAAEKFARQHRIETETFADKDEMYEEASGENVLVYDAGPSDIHPDNIYESLRHGFHHLTEKPSSMSREEHISEKKLAENEDVTFSVDFIERESPVVKKTLEIVKDEDIDSIKVFRESCMGLEKIIDPVNRIGVLGGDILDKMIHEAYVLDFLEASTGDYGLEIEDVDAEFFVPKNFGSEKLLGLKGGYTYDLEDAATGMTHAEFSFEDVSIELNSSWLGISDKAAEEASRIRKITGEHVIDRDYVEDDGEAFVDEEARFFVVEGSRNLAGDMLEKKLYDLDSRGEIATRDFMHDQLYRMLENTVFEAAGIHEREITEKETDVFMNAIFDVRDAAVEGKNYSEVLEISNERLEKLRIRDGKILENEESERIAG
ncbi:Gfo/Idh/MocA family protein [Candidatus Nanosalina sp. VS9-1]|uniref:Gfo/Idh/MocA family protein n=1 Tax=Candidatus Nanosalina sp. VS9-1 TaxID=3388566 RepID=UPI0039E066F0